MQPAERLARQPWMRAKPTLDVIAALEADGGTARFVGGCVRDAALGRSVQDIDIATDRPPQEVMRLLTAAGINAVPTGLDHGTVTAVTGGSHFEVTSLRRDVETFGRRARVAFTDDWTADAARRDFTINALYCDADGTVYDPVGGLADLRAGRVRFVGDASERIAEDLLRLLRFFRFYATYGTGKPDREAMAAARAFAPRLGELSAERVWSELRRLLLAPRAPEAFLLMQSDGVLPHVLPEAAAIRLLAPVAEVEARHGAKPDALRRLAAVVEVDPPGAGALSHRLRHGRAETRRLVALVENAGAIAGELEAQGLRRALYRLGSELVLDLLLIAEARGVAGLDWDALHAVRAGWTPRRLPVGGQDAAALGVPPGPEMGAALAAVEAWWIAEDFAPDRDACLARLAEAVQGR